MTVLNRILNIFILILAITSMIGAYFLFKERDALYTRAEKLSDTIAELSKKTDENSGTELSNLIHRNPVTVEGSDAKLPGGTLGWAKFHEYFDQESESYPEFDKLLKEVITQIEKLRVQRDKLAEKLFEWGQLFLIIEKEAKVDDFRELDAYGINIEELENEIQALNERDKILLSTLVEVAEIVGININLQQLQDVKIDQSESRTSIITTCNNIFQGFKAMTSTMAGFTRKLDKAFSTTELSDKLQSNIDDNGIPLRSELPALSRFTNEFNSLADILINKYTNEQETNRRLQKTVTQQKRKISSIQKQVNEFEAKNNKLEERQRQIIAEKKEWIEKYNSLLTKHNELIGQANGTDPPPDNTIHPEQNPNFIPPSEPTVVLKVDYEWNYIIIDKGKKSNIREGMIFFVSRGEQFISKIIIRNVYDDYASADILTRSPKAIIIEGDRIVYPSSNINR